MVGRWGCQAFDAGGGRPARRRPGVVRTREHENVPTAIVRSSTRGARSAASMTFSEHQQSADRQHPAACVPTFVVSCPSIGLREVGATVDVDVGAGHVRVALRRDERDDRADLARIPARGKCAGWPKCSSIPRMIAYRSSGSTPTPRPRLEAFRRVGPRRHAVHEISSGPSGERFFVMLVTAAFAAVGDEPGALSLGGVRREVHDRHSAARSRAAARTQRTIPSCRSRSWRPSRHR